MTFRYIVQKRSLEGPAPFEWKDWSYHERLSTARRMAKPFRDAGEPVRIVYLID